MLANLKRCTDDELLEFTGRILSRAEPLTPFDATELDAITAEWDRRAKERRQQA